MMYVHAFLVFLCAGFYFVNINCADEGPSMGRDYLDSGGDPSPALCVDRRELCKPYDKMEISIESSSNNVPGIVAQAQVLPAQRLLYDVKFTFNDYVGTQCLPPGDPLRSELGLHLALNVVVTWRYKCRAALKRVEELGSRGASLSHVYDIGIRSSSVADELLYIKKSSRDFPAFPLLHEWGLYGEIAEDLLCAIVRGREKRRSVFFPTLEATLLALNNEGDARGALTDEELLDTTRKIFGEIIAFDEPSPNELRLVQRKTKGILQKQQAKQDQQKELEQQMEYARQMARATQERQVKPKKEAIRQQQQMRVAQQRVQDRQRMRNKSRAVALVMGTALCAAFFSKKK